MREVADFGPGVIDHQIELAVDEVVERQRHGPLGVGDQADRPVRAADPGRDLVGVVDRRREADELDVIRTEDDRFFPGRAALGIGEIVNLVEDDGIDVVQVPRRLQEHVAQYLGRHDHDAGIPILRDVAGEQADLVAVDRAQIAIFLVGERLDRRRVDDAASPLKRFPDAELGDHGLAGAGWSRDHHGVAGEQRLDGLTLERIERERVVRFKLCDRVVELVEAAGKRRIGNEGGSFQEFGGGCAGQ